MLIIQISVFYYIYAWLIKIFVVCHRCIIDTKPNTDQRDGVTPKSTVLDILKYLRHTIRPNEYDNSLCFISQPSHFIYRCMAIFIPQREASTWVGVPIGMAMVGWCSAYVVHARVFRNHPNEKNRCTTDPRSNCFCRPNHCIRNTASSIHHRSIEKTIDNHHHHIRSRFGSCYFSNYCGFLLCGWVSFFCGLVIDYFSCKPPIKSYTDKT
jgi:hypothetical protein